MLPLSLTPGCWLSCRRWIERNNSKLREKPKKEEVKRLKAFVESAFEQDPRMNRRRAAEKAIKCVWKSARSENDTSQPSLLAVPSAVVISAFE